MSGDRAIGAKEGLRASIRAYGWLGVLAAGFVIGAVYQPDWLYSWIKVLHIAAVISWMVGLFYLPRLFVYHSEAVSGEEPAATFEIMETRLLRVIMLPAMAFVWASGIWLAWIGFSLVGVWLWIKIGLVMGLTVFHLFLAKSAREFKNGSAVRTARRWRMINEIPTLLMLAIIVLVVLKPFA